MANKEVIFKHMSALQAKHLVGDRVWNKYTTFTFVRNPWDRIVSLYSYHNQRVPNIFPLALKSFEDWVRGDGTGTRKKLMSEYVSDDQGNVIVDFIGHYENLENDFRTICSRIGMPQIELGWVKKTKRSDYREYYTDETREIVTKWVQKDAEMFGYEF